MFERATDSRCGGGQGRRAFSLAEMMIALIILGFGLLVIGAALPVGLTYTRRTFALSTGEVAAEYALDVIQQHVRLCGNPLDENENLRYRTDLFRPRYRHGEAGVTAGELAMDGARMYEPRIKVRPLLPVPIDPAAPDAEFAPGDPSSAYHAVEKCIATWLGAGTLVRKEFDVYDASDNWTAPSIPSVLAVYPPAMMSVVNGTTFDPVQFCANDTYKYERVPVPPAACRQAMERRVAWVAFYRRVSYREGSDPQLYEFITVAVRTSGEGRGFLRPTGGAVPTMGPGGAADLSAGRGSLETVSPVPWLVTFSGLHLLVTDYYYDNNKPGGGDRPLNPGFVDPPTLRFTASAAVARLLPPGSIFIPAVNDLAPSATNGTPYAGFVPHAPDTLPIYEVVERKQVGDNAFQILVKNNGFYPWVYTGNPNDGGLWPVWVIPPVFAGGDDDEYGPVFENRSPVLAVARRVIWLPEVP